MIHLALVNLGGCGRDALMVPRKWLCGQFGMPPFFVWLVAFIHALRCLKLFQHVLISGL